MLFLFALATVNNMRC